MPKRHFSFALLLILLSLALSAYSLPTDKTIQNNPAQLARLRINCIYQGKPIAALIRINEIGPQSPVGRQVVEKWSVNGQLSTSLPKGKSYRVAVVGKLSASQNINNLTANTIINLDLHETE